MSLNTSRVLSTTVYTTLHLLHPTFRRIVIRIVLSVMIHEDQSLAFVFILELIWSYGRVKSNKLYLVPSLKQSIEVWQLVSVSYDGYLI